DARHNGGPLDRLEDRRDRREDVQDRREDVRDRREDVRDRREDRRDVREDRRDVREDGWDRREDRRDRFDNRRDFRNDNNYRNGRWNNGWRNDNRYNWRSWRGRNSSLFRWRWYAPRGWRYGYRRFGVGHTLASVFLASSYWLSDPYRYRLPHAYGNHRWIRYYNDVVLVDVRTGRIIDVEHGFFY
ncbi:MAG: RcnB family protein, partial [Sphingomonadaceae bacterium]|nr:RcnB family protein [Sphingomonadaceae bacterium]